MTLLALIGINVLVSLAGFRALTPERPQDTRRAESFLFIPWQVARGENGLGFGSGLGLGRLDGIGNRIERLT